MANTVTSLKPLYNCWSAVVNMDTAATLAVIPSGTLIIPMFICGGMKVTAASAFQSLSVIQANGDEVIPLGIGAGGTSSLNFPPPLKKDDEIKLDGLSIVCNSTTATTTTAIGIIFKFAGGAEIVEV